MTKKIAFFIESFYRTPDPNGICVKSIVDELNKQKNIIYVYTSKRGFKQPSFEIVDGVYINRFDRSIAYLLRNIGSYYNNFLAKIAKILSRILLGLSYRIKCFIWPLHSITLIIKYILSAVNEHKKEEFDVVIGVYLHIEEVLSAVFIKLMYPNVKLIVYTLDALSGKATPEILGNTTITKKSIQRWESYIFSKADSICVMESHRTHYDNIKYNNVRSKFKYMDIPTLKIDKIQLSDHRNKICTMLYTGYSSMSNGRDPLYLLEILKDISDVEFHMYGSRSDVVEKSIQNSGLLNKVVFLHGAVSHEEIISLQGKADFLVNLGSDNETAIPSKIFEYIVQRKPIISFYKMEKDPSIPYLKKYANSLLINEDKMQIKSNIEAFKNFIYSKNHKIIDDKYLIDNFFNNTPIPMVEEILKGID